MGSKTAIPWCHHTFSPWWGCTRVSPGCDNCYADSLARRFALHLWDNGVKKFQSDAYWGEPLKWNEKAAQAGERRRVFCGSMCDVFEDDGKSYETQCRLNSERDRLWHLIGRTQHLDWLLLSKRPENMPTLAPHSWRAAWPVNVWPMATIENAAVAPARLRAMLRVPAAMRGLSMEPLLGPVRLPALHLPDFRWIIIGCEKLPGNRPGRPCNQAWIRDLLFQTWAYPNRCFTFVKQLAIDGRVSDNPADWPEDLRIQEFPR